MHPMKVRDMIVNQLLSSDEVKIHGYELVKCQSCGGPTLDNYYICPTCGWEYDPACKSDTTVSSVNGGVSPYDYMLDNFLGAEG